ncbi:hypothetical protein TNCV_31001 [Trichonephila clavipes]|nr:hypothetical protein TNCV_31001 [Trichonephila clavipes]
MVSKWKPIIFMQDGGSLPYISFYQSILAEQNIPLLDWLGNSPDMNLIENIWELMKREVAKDVITNKSLRKNNSRVESSSSNAGDSTVLY